MWQEKREKLRRKEKRGSVWNVLEREGRGREKRGKKGKKKKRSKGTCVEEKKRGKKNKEIRMKRKNK